MARFSRSFPGREDVRRRQMELKFAMGQLRDAGAEADLQILLSLPQNKTDGDLMFMMGRCREDGKNDLDAQSLVRSGDQAQCAAKD